MVLDQQEIMICLDDCFYDQVTTGCQKTLSCGVAMNMTKCLCDRCPAPAAVTHSLSSHLVTIYIVIDFKISDDHAKQLVSPLTLHIVDLQSKYGEARACR